MAMASPMARGPDPARSDLCPSHVAKTVQTRTNVMSSSTMKVCVRVTPGPGDELPRSSLDPSGLTKLKYTDRQTSML